MKRFFFAVSVVALAACVASAEDKPATGGTTGTTPAVTATTGTTYYQTSQPTRRGLFARLRNRNNMTYSTTPSMATPAQPMPTPAPQPMPGTKPAGDTTTNTGMVVQASGNLPPGRYTTTDGTIIQISGTGTTTTPMTSTRTGLFSRLRMR